MKNQIETNRLVIRQSSLDNYDNVVGLLTDPAVMKYMSSGLRSKEQVLQTIQTMIYHEQRYGFSIGDIYEKRSYRFVGRGGLMYFKLNDQQPDVELGFVFHQEYWGQGFGTEIAQALRCWAFANLPINKLLAAVHPDNKSSRRILEKIGMHYVGKKIWQGREHGRYETLQLRAISERLTIRVPTVNDDDKLQQLITYYHYELSHLPEPHNYVFDQKDNKIFVIDYEQELIGFYKIKSTAPFQITDLFITKKFQRRGIGLLIACHCFNTLIGDWCIQVPSGFETAYRFWRHCIERYTNGGFTEQTYNMHEANCLNSFLFQSFQKTEI